MPTLGGAPCRASRTLASAVQTEISAARKRSREGTAWPGTGIGSYLRAAGYSDVDEPASLPARRLYLTKMRGYYREPFPVTHHMTTGLDGRFRFTVPIAGIHNEKGVVAALAANHGVGWVSVWS